MPKKKDRNYLLLKRFCLGHGANLFGVADISGVRDEFAFPQELVQKFGQAVVLGVRLSASVLQEIQTHPTKLYFHHYRTLNAFLDQLALRVTNFIQSQGFSALAIPASQIIDWENQRAHLSHKKIGYLAGLGWIGRNNLLVNKTLGSQFRLVTILTDMPLKVNRPLDRDCQECRLCISACPVKAIKESPADFGYLVCFEKLKEFQKLHLVDQYICGICVNVCKGNKG